MKYQAQSTMDRWSIQDVAEKRVISRMLLDMLITEGAYKLAAEVVSGFVDGFRNYAARLEESVADKVSASCLEDLESLLITCRSEIAYQQMWSKDVLASLPNHTEAAVLRAAFAHVETFGANLLQEVESATIKYEEAQGNA
jgi:vesicle coat complex subunit